jgi:hypothetical protein
MQRDLGIYGGLLALGLGLAYWASLPSPEGAEEKVQIFSIEPKQISEVSFTSKDEKAKVDITTTAAKRSNDERYWISYEKSEPSEPSPGDLDGGEKPKDKAAAAKDAKAPATGESKKDEKPPTPPKVTKERFLAGERLDDIVKGLNPLLASRVFKDVSDDQLNEFGLKDAQQVFTIKGSDGQIITLKLGRKSYGSSSRFAMEVSKEGKPGRVFLIDDQNFENLERAPVRLYDRRLVAVELGDVQKATIISEGKPPKKLAHTQRDKSGELLWTDDEEGATAKPSNDSWMERISKLRLLSYGEEADEARLVTVKPAFEVVLEKDGKVVDTMRFKKETVEGKPVYWVTSDFLKVHAKVPPARLEPIEKDLGTVLSSPKS